MLRDVVWYESDNPNGFRTGQRLTVDEPCVTVMAAGLGGDSLGHWYLVWGGRVVTIQDEFLKPPYRVPSMADIAAIPWNGFTVASTFSGCGGSCLGYRMAGYRVVWASEFVPIAAENYRANAPETILDMRDIRTVTASEILTATGIKTGELDLLDGSPPCQPFSTAGKREKTWGKQRDYGDHSQRADDLFFEYARLVRDLQPRVFVAENVSGLVKGTAKGYFKEILATLKACGYQVQARLLDAQWLGVPQMRQRIIFMGVRSDLGIAPAFPSPLPYRYSVRDALPWIDRVQVGRDDFRDSAGRPSPLRLATDGQRSSTTLDCPVGLVEIEGANGFNGHAGSSTDETAATVQASRPVRLQTQRATLRQGKHGYLPGANRSLDRPGPTVPVSPDGAGYFGHDIVQPESTRLLPPSRARAGNNVAPAAERRKFTIAELRRICAFPDDFILRGSYAEQWARLGNAVPPVMMRAIAEMICSEILEPSRGA